MNNGIVLGGRLSNGHCRSCRFWFDLIARSIGADTVEALCEAPEGPKTNKMTRESDACSDWQTDVIDDEGAF